MKNSVTKAQGLKPELAIGHKNTKTKTYLFRDNKTKKS